jgi:alpha-glucuronidase
MSFVNLPPALQAIFSDLVKRIQKLENVNRFYATVYPIINTDSIVVTGLTTDDITDPKVGQIWLNTTANALRVVDKNGLVSVIATPNQPAPATATSTGIAGQIAYDATHIYVCVATNTWVRATLATW